MSDNIPASNQVTLEDALQIAKTQMQSGNLYIAEMTYKDILKVEPHNPEALFGLGLVNYYKGAPDKSIPYYEQSLEHNPDSETCLNAYAIALSSVQRHEDALAAWRNALKLKPDFPEILCNMANTQWTIGAHEDAKKSAEKAIDLKPEYAEAYINLSNALIELDLKDEAVTALNTAVDLKPDLPNSYINLGNLLRSLGQISESEKVCRKAVEVDSASAIAHNNLGNALRDQARFEEAEEHYRQATKLQPDYYQAHNNLCIALMDLLRFDEAVSAAQYAITFKADYADAYINLAIAQKETGQLGAAKVSAQTAIQLKPDSAMSHAILADIVFLENRYEEAEAIVKKAMELDPDSERLYLKLAEVLEHAHRLQEAIDTLDEGIKINPEMPELYHKKATAYFMHNHLDKAIESIDKCLDLNPNLVSAIATKSEIIQSLGDMDEALRVARQGMEINDKLPFLYFTLSKLKKFTDEDDEDLQKMLALSANAEKFGKLQASSLHFAIYKAWQDLKQTDKAFDALKKANDFKRETLPYNQQDQKNGLLQIKQKYTPEFLESLEGKGYVDEELTPVFILGMPRSGTTLTEQILASHSKVFGAGELGDLLDIQRSAKDITPENCRDMGQKYVERVRRLSPSHAYITDKMPGNFTQIGQIVATLPNAKIIHCMRDPVDTCLSCYKQLFARGQYWSYDLEELGHYHNMYRDLMAFWNDLLPGRILNINYEDTVSDTEKQVHKLLDFVGLEWDEACLTPHKSNRPILTASKAQVRKPIYQTSIKSSETYKEQLAPLIEALGQG